jgi:hypothetical protein
MPGGEPTPSPFAAAKPVESGWFAPAWYRSFNAANSRIRNAEGADAEKAARASGRTRAEAKISFQEYDQVSGKSYSSLFLLKVYVIVCLTDLESYRVLRQEAE